jgi:hypothetical protein
VKSIYLIGLLLVVGCYDGRNTSDEIQRQQQERMLMEGTSAVGMPAIKNFRERRMLKEILELRDQTSLVTYCYLENQLPNPVKGYTSLGGKLTFLGETIGFGIPYATQFTNPQKPARLNPGPGQTGVSQWAVMAQADPNGLFSPASAEGTWLLMRDKTTGQTRPQYIESRVVVLTFKLPLD